jgi:hypothetical protein
VTREYAEWFNTTKFLNVGNKPALDIHLAVRPYVDGGSETVIIVVYTEG